MKIFGIGFHKTGTSSLCEALTLLGYNVAEPDFDLSKELKQNKYDSIIKLVNEYDAFQDNPWPLLYKFLDKLSPGNKFILTIREDEKWIKSIVIFFGENNSGMREWIYNAGHPKGNEDVYLKIYRKHNLEVAEYFKHRSDDILIIDFSQGDCWKKLCNFLNKKIPSVPFPHAKKTAYPKRSILKKIMSTFN